MRGRLCVLVVCCLALAVSVAAAPPKEFKANVQAAGSMLALSVPVGGAVGAYLVVAGPNDFRVERAFTGNEPIALNLGQIKDAQGQPVAFADGNYKWELRVNTPSAGGEATAPVSESSVFAGPSVEKWTSSGEFKVQSGGIVPVVEPVRGGTPIQVTTQSTGGSQPAANAGLVTPEAFSAGNFYIGGTGLCVGCADLDGELLPPEILLKGSDPYLTVHDTIALVRWRWSNFASSTRLYWELIDNNAGGIATEPVELEFNAPTNTLYLAKSGAVGIGTSTPAASMHLTSSGSPAPELLLDSGTGSPNQRPFLYSTGSGWFGIGAFSTGNCALCIGGTPAQVDNTLNISGGNVGIRTITPTHPFEVSVSGTTDGIVMAAGANQTDSLSLKVQHPNGVIGFALAGGTGAFFTTAHQHDAIVFGQPGYNLLLGVGGSEWVRITNAGKVGINMTAPTHFLDVGVSGAYCNGGAWVDGSSREYKQDIRELSGEDAAEAFASLNPVRFEYKAMPGEGHVGFIAEDVPDLVATPDRKGLSPMDVVAVLTKVVQEQKSTLDRQQRLMEEQHRAIADLTAKVAELEKRR